MTKGIVQQGINSDETNPYQSEALTKLLLHFSQENSNKKV